MKAKLKPSPFKQLLRRLRIPQLPPLVRNRYVVTGAAFAVWMVCFDDNSVLQQTQRRYNIYEQNNQIEYYQAGIREVNEEREALFGNAAALERFARERYKMVADGQDLYLVIER
ncbi:MAG TPA: hypothetical protein VEY71_00260 [Chitinophagales bacterium]|nr:hypothetical protein [Chitinophagales bacterium]